MFTIWENIWSWANVRGKTIYQHLEQYACRWGMQALRYWKVWIYTPHFLQISVFIYISVWYLIYNFITYSNTQSWNYNCLCKFKKAFISYKSWYVWVIFRWYLIGFQQFNVSFDFSVGFHILFLFEFSLTINLRPVNNFHFYKVIVLGLNFYGIF